MNWLPNEKSIDLFSDNFSQKNNSLGNVQRSV